MRRSPLLDPGYGLRLLLARGRVSSRTRIIIMTFDHLAIFADVLTAAHLPTTGLLWGPPGGIMHKMWEWPLSPGQKLVYIFKNLCTG